jgi:hypothetical protein
MTDTKTLAPAPHRLACPACGHATFTARQKWFASDTRPVACRVCRATCAVAPTTASGIFVACVLALTACGFAAAWVRSPWVFAAGAVATVALGVWRWRAATLVVVAGSQRPPTGLRLAVDGTVWLLLGFLLG